jgi:hypothetical protein
MFVMFTTVKLPFLSCIISTALCSVLAASCAGSSSEKPIELASSSLPFAVPAEFTKELSERKTDTRRVDVTGDGFEDAIVTVFPKDSTGARIGFETMRIFEYNTSTKKFVSAFEEKYYYGKSVDVRDLDRDGKPEICVNTDGGGTSLVASLGMAIVKKSDGKYRTLVAFDAGKPEIIMFGDDSIPVVVSNDEYWPEYLARMEAVTVADSVVVLGKTGNEAGAVRERFLAEMTAKAEDRYVQSRKKIADKRTPETTFALYSAAVAGLRAMQHLADGGKQARSFASAERPFWRSELPRRFSQALDDTFRPTSNDAPSAGEKNFLRQMKQ